MYELYAAAADEPQATHRYQYGEVKMGGLIARRINNVAKETMSSLNGDHRRGWHEDAALEQALAAWDLQI